MKALRYTQAMVDEFVRAGYWTDETFYDPTIATRVAR
jgi:hypothetical protein